jgi:hypothetical protein
VATNSGSKGLRTPYRTRAAQMPSANAFWGASGENVWITSSFPMRSNSPGYSGIYSVLLSCPTSSGDSSSRFQLYRCFLRPYRTSPTRGDRRSVVGWVTPRLAKSGLRYRRPKHQAEWCLINPINRGCIKGIACLCLPCPVFLLRTKRRRLLSAWLSRYPPTCALSRGWPFLDFLGTRLRFLYTDVPSSQHRDSNRQNGRRESRGNRESRAKKASDQASSVWSRTEP